MYANDPSISMPSTKEQGSVRIHGLTTVFGNNTLEQTTKNASRILKEAHTVDIPIYVGADRPLVAPKPVVCEFHGSDGLGELRVPTLDEDVTVAMETAAIALIRLSHEHNKRLVIIALGPLTNIALACRIDPTFSSRVCRLVWLGGTIEAPGNVTPVAEYNTHCDPEAAHIVTTTFETSTMVTWCLCLRCPLDWTLLDMLRSQQSSLSKFLSEVTHKSYYIPPRMNSKGALVCDLLAMMVALHPNIITACRHSNLQIELHGSLSRGQTVVDWRVFKDNALHVGHSNTNVIQNVNMSMIDQYVKTIFIPFVAATGRGMEGSRDALTATANGGSGVGGGGSTGAVDQPFSFFSFVTGHVPSDSSDLSAPPSTSSPKSATTPSSLLLSSSPSPASSSSNSSESSVDHQSTLSSDAAIAVSSSSSLSSTPSLYASLIGSSSTESPSFESSSSSSSPPAVGIILTNSSYP